MWIKNSKIKSTEFFSSSFVKRILGKKINTLNHNSYPVQVTDYRGNRKCSIENYIII